MEQIFPGDCLSQLDLVLYQAGEYICRQGSEQDVIPYFLKGRLKIIHSLENGSDTILEIQEKPGLLGEIELLLDRVCISSVIADQDSASRPAPSLHLKKLPPAWSNLLRSTAKTLAEKLHQINYLAPANFIISQGTPRYTFWSIAMKWDPQAQDESAGPAFWDQLPHLSRVIKQMIEEA